MLAPLLCATLGSVGPTEPSSVAFAERWELGLSAAGDPFPRLIQHWLVDVHATLNLVESLGVGVVAGYAHSSETGLARDVANSPAQPARMNDIPNLWRLTGHVLAGVRLQPIHGSFGVAAKGMYFQLYAWLGAGVAWFIRDSLAWPSRPGAIVPPPLHEERSGPLFGAALGFRIWLMMLGDHHSLVLEWRDWAWLDSYRQFSGAVVTGLTNMMAISVGYTFLF